MRVEVDKTWVTKMLDRLRVVVFFRAWHSFLSLEEIPPSYFPLNPGGLIGILISLFMK